MRAERHSTAGSPIFNQSADAEIRGDVEEQPPRDHFLRLMFFEPSEGLVAAPKSDTGLPPEQRRRRFGPLPESQLQGELTYHLPDPTMATHVRADSPAIEVMTDLRRVAAVTTGPFVSVDEANATMIKHGVRSLFVVDGDRILGLVTSTDILGEKPVQVTQRRGIRHDEVMVRDIMRLAERLEVIDLADVLKAKVGDVIETLKRARRQHGLVVDRDTLGRQMVRGIFSLTQIARQMGITPHPPEIGQTFAEIEAAIGA